MDEFKGLRISSLIMFVAGLILILIATKLVLNFVSGGIDEYDARPFLISLLGVVLGCFELYAGNKALHFEDKIKEFMNLYYDDEDEDFENDEDIEDTDDVKVKETVNYDEKSEIEISKDNSINNSEIQVDNIIVKDNPSENNNLIDGNDEDTVYIDEENYNKLKKYVTEYINSCVDLAGFIIFFVVIINLISGFNRYGFQFNLVPTLLNLIIPIAFYIGTNNARAIIQEML